MIDRLVHGLAVGADLTSEEILDVLWLAATYPESHSTPGWNEPGSHVPARDEANKRAFEDSHVESIPAGEFPLPLHLDVERPGNGQRLPAMEVGFGVPRPIRDALALPMALRRFRQVRAPGPHLAVDIDATVEATAEAGRLLPVLSRPKQRALDLAMVVDDSWSMRIWNDTFDDLERLLGQTGAFRAVSRWRLSPRSGRIRPDTRPGARNAPQPPERLIDPSGRRLVLVVTDARDAAWYTTPPWEAVSAWCAAMPTVLVQVLPPHYWTGTAIGDPYITARARRPAAPNRQYEHRLAWWADGDDPGGLPLPVITLDPSAVDSWAQAVVNGTAWSTGITATPPDPNYAPVTSDGAAADALVNGFFSRASPGAQRLARILASAATLSMPLIAVLRGQLAPETGVLELAEILASGLLIETRPTSASGQPLLRYQPGTREILQRGTTVLEEWDAYAAVSWYLEERPRYGGSLRALVRDPAGSATLGADDEPFAELQHRLATRLGSRAASAETLVPPNDRVDAAEPDSATADVPDIWQELQAEDGQALGFEDVPAIHSGAMPVGVSGASSAFSDEVVLDALSDELARLTGSAAFTVAEFDVNTATIFQISRDQHGTPTAVWWKYRYEDGVRIIGEPDQWSEAMADPEQFYRRVAPEFIVRTLHPMASGLRDLLPETRELPVYECQAPLQDLLRTAMRESSLVLGYELAVLKRAPTRHSGAERLVLTGLPLFSPGDTPGAQVTVQVNVEPTGDEGTAFAVVTREPHPERPRQARRLRPLQVQAAVVPPGSFALTAVLTRPGQVRFRGLPVPVGDSSRSWDDFERLVPNQLTAQAPVHLVCLTEVCGGDDRLQHRIDRLVELVSEAQSGDGPLRVSVVAYGAHGVAWKVEDRPPDIRAWAAPTAEAIKALRGLVSRPVDEREYQGAAQLECGLRLVRQRLVESDGRPVVVTAGGRPAHPPRLDTSRQIIPCPDWVDGIEELSGLLRLPGITFGALRDPECQGEIWEQLGRHAAAMVDDAVNMETFAANLGLRVAAQTVPFPVIE